jgi:phosphoribosyl 1,2-cyclic phosphodiesterase
MNEKTFSVKFWGTRGSHPTPGPDTVKVGGNTSCVEVRAGEYTIILDAGTGIIPLGRDLMRRGKPVQAVILFSHLHHDHTQGFPFFAPAYHPAARLSMYGPGASEKALEELLTNNQTPPVFPVSLREMSSTKEIHSLQDVDVIVIDETDVHLGKNATPNRPDAVVIRLMRSHAHPGGVLVYRIEWQGRSIVYATDTEGYVGTDRRLATFARQADLLIHDAQYSEADYRGEAGFGSKQGFGHSTPQMACELARAAGVKQLALFHHDPNNDDEKVAELEAQAQEIFPAAFAACEGLEVEVSSEQLALSKKQFSPATNHQYLQRH